MAAEGLPDEGRPDLRREELVELLLELGLVIHDIHGVDGLVGHLVVELAVQVVLGEVEALRRQVGE